jgi:hypothetical protein
VGSLFSGLLAEVAGVPGLVAFLGVAEGGADLSALSLAARATARSFSCAAVFSDWLARSSAARAASSRSFAFFIARLCVSLRFLSLYCRGVSTLGCAIGLVEVCEAGSSVWIDPKPSGITSKSCRYH